MWKVICELIEDYWVNSNAIGDRPIKTPYTGTRKYKNYDNAVKRLNDVLEQFKDDFKGNDEVDDENADITRDENGNITEYNLERFLDGEYKNFYLRIEKIDG